MAVNVSQNLKYLGNNGGTFKQCVYGEAREECPVVKTKKELKKACQNTTPWCNVEGACGIHTPRVKGHWDYCDCRNRDSALRP